MTPRIAVATATVLIGALVLTGCTEIRSIGEKAGIELALRNLTTTLEDNHGVTLTSAITMDAEYRYDVAVTIDRAEVTPESRDEVIRAVDDTLAGAAFGSAPTWFSIGSDAESYFSQNLFGLDTLETDLEYWHAVEDAVGEVSFFIGADPDGEGALRRMRGIYKPTPMDYGALASVPLDPTAFDSWASPGVTAQGTLPSADVAAALAALLEVVPLHDYSDPDQPAAIDLQWSGPPDTSIWTLHSPLLTELATNPAASADWPLAVEVASRLAAGGIRDAHFSFFSDFGAGGIVHLGECGVELAVGPVDTELYDSLQSAGVILPVGSAPGWCAVG